MKLSWLLHTLGAQAGLLPTQCLSPKLNSSQLSSAIHHASLAGRAQFWQLLTLLGSCFVGKEWGPFFVCVNTLQGVHSQGGYRAILEIMLESVGD